MITMSNFGNNGRLCNQLFQYASLIGIANKYGRKLLLPKWEYSKYFEGEFPECKINGLKCHETKFHYNEDWVVALNGNIDFSGYFQSRKYWQHCENEVKSALTFKSDFKKQVSKGYDFSKETIAIHIRRGDYVGNNNYYQLPIHYFILALFSIEKWQEKNIIVFSDDIDYCKVHFQCLPNVKFSEGKTAIEDLCLMSQCDHFILSNSSYSWWGAYLGQKEHSKVIRPNYLFDGKLKQINNDKDFWPEEWICFDHVGKKIDLSDVTFTIPVTYDSKDRKDNLELCVKQLNENFDTCIIVGETGHKFSEINCNHLGFDYPVFHRTKMLNYMAGASNTPIIFNWDADILIAPLQIWYAVEKLRNGSDMVFPYDGRFARMPREQWYNKINKSNDIGLVGSTKFKGMETNAAVSVGGSVGFKKASFIEGGMENENFVSYSPEDVEREIRFNRLGFNIDRVKGALYHMNHWCGPDSSTSNPYFKQGQEELEKVKAMSVEQLRQYVKSWSWIK